MGIAEVLAALGSIGGLVLYLLKSSKATPDEKRRKSMVKLDSALDEAKVHNSVEELSKWFGSKL